MEIISNQCYELNNLVSISGKYKAAEVQNLLIDLVKPIKTILLQMEIMLSQQLNLSR